MNAVYSSWKSFPDVISGLDAGHSWAMVNLPFLPRSGQKSKWKMWDRESLVSTWGWWRWWWWGRRGSSMLPRLATRLFTSPVSRKWDRWLLTKVRQDSPSPVSPMVPNVSKYNGMLFAWVGVGRRRHEERSLQLRNSTIRNQFSWLVTLSYTGLECM